MADAPATPDDPPKVGKALTQKVGPFPGYVWVMIAAGGALLFYLWQRKHSASQSTSQSDTSTNSYTESLAAQGFTQYDTANQSSMDTATGADMIGQSGPRKSGKPAPSPNRGIDAGTETSGLAFPTGKPAPSPGQTIAPGSTGATAQPRAVQYVTVRPWPQSGSSLYQIAQEHGMSLAALEKLNPNITDPNLIYPGESVRVA